MSNEKIPKEPGDLNTSQGRLARAVFRGALKPALAALAEGANPLELDQSGRSLLALAAEKGSESDKVLRLLAKLGCDLNEGGRSGQPPLAAAIRSGRHTQALTLMELGARIDWKDPKGRGLLHLACADMRSSGAIEAALLRAGADPSATDRRGFTPLHYAAETGCAEACRGLIAAGADVDAATINGNTPLHKAAEGSRSEIIEILLSAGASPTVKNGALSTPVERQASFGSRSRFKDDVFFAAQARLESAQELDELSQAIPSPSVKKAPKGL